MAKSTPPEKPKGSKSRDVRQVACYMSEELYQGLRKLAFDSESKQAVILRNLLEAELKKKGYLKK